MKRLFLLSLLCIALLAQPAFALDSDTSRKTLTGIKGVYVMSEELQPNLQKYTKKAEVSRDQLQKQVESQLKQAGIRVLTKEEWLQTPGRPALYLNVNTHEYQRYQFAYDVRIEVQQIATLEASPGVKTLASTWSTNMTGTVNIGTVSTLYDSVRSVTAVFIKAYRQVNPK